MALNSKWKNQMRGRISEFLQERLQTRLEKLKEGDPKRQEFIARFEQSTWLDDAARRARQIQVVTHLIKAPHSGAKGTELCVTPDQLTAHDAVGTHNLGRDFTRDVSGNAAQLDVYRFLQLDVDGVSLLDGLLRNEDAALQALSADVKKARELRDNFAGLIEPRDESITSHTNAKQVYWLVGEEGYFDATDDSYYHLLAPLHPTSLIHEIYDVLQEHRFGDQTKEARQARRNNEAYDETLHEYPDLAVQKLGGANTQNVSRLNNQRRGTNYLLASLPPTWRSRRLREPWQIMSVFENLFLQRRDVRRVVTSMRDFLQNDPPSNMDTRNRVDTYVSYLIDELIVLAHELQEGWPTGWTADTRCDLVREEQLWLDPWRAEYDAEFRQEWLAMAWPDQIGHRFGNWLNEQLAKQLTVGEIEHRHWKKELLIDESDSGWMHHLHRIKNESAIKKPVATEGES